MKGKKKMLLLGWDAADWKVINPLLEQGKMPALKKLIEQGVMGNIATLEPPYSPMLWSSIATGTYAFKHGVHGFIEPTEDGNKLQPVTSHSIQMPTVWDILNQNGYKTNVVGWWPSHPAKDIDGVQVSNFYGKTNKASKQKNWTPAKNSISVKDLEDKLNRLRVHPSEFGIHQLASFITELELLNEEDSTRVNVLLKDLAECVSIHSAATYLAEHTEWDFMAVYYNAIDHISHHFMRYHPPKLPWVEKNDFKKYNQVINRMYEFHDMMLGRMLDIIDDNCYVMVLSDHGFHSDEKRLKHLPKEPAAIAREHNYMGIMALKGPDIKKDELVFGTSLLDVCPTILNIFDIPVSREMDGKVQVNIYKEPKEVEFIDSWKKENENRTGLKLSNIESDAIVQQLVDLGYVDSQMVASNEKVKKVYDENQFNLARSYFDAGKFYETSLILEKLTDIYPENVRYHKLLANCYVERFEQKKLEETIIRLEKISNNKAYLNLIKGKLEMVKQNHNKALDYFNEIFLPQSKYQPALALHLANCYYKLKQYDQAIKHYNLHLETYHTNSSALQGKGMAYFYKKQYSKAIDVLIDSVTTKYFNPTSHFYLGLAFTQIEKYQEAANAFAVALTQAPSMQRAREELISLYTNHLDQPEMVTVLRKQMEERVNDQLIVVSGLPRSGTSLMMQILEALDVPLLVDNKRPKDANNPKGFYELEAVKHLDTKARFLKGADGKGVKVVSPLIRHLPLYNRYKVLFMQRPIDQVLSSQEKMVAFYKGKPADTMLIDAEQRLLDLNTQVLNYMKERPQFDVLEVQFENLSKQFSHEVARICSFLNISEKSIPNLFDKSLHRNK